MRTWPLTLVFILAVFSPSLFGQSPSLAAIPGSKVTGRLETIEGMQVLSVWGTLEERSFAEGYLMAEAIHDLVDGFMLSPQVSFGSPRAWDMLIRPAVLGRFRFSGADRVHARCVVAGMKARDPRWVRIEALKRNLQSKDLLVASCIPDMVGLLCSSFTAWGAKTRGEAVLFGRNLDYFSTESFTRRTMLIVRAPRGERAGWVNVGWPGLRGCATGFSDRGVGLAIHDVSVKGRKEKSERFTSRILALQDLIETLDPDDDIGKEAVARMGALRFALGGNGMLGWSRRGKHGGAVLEFDGRDKAVSACSEREPAAGEPFILCSNHHRLRSENGHDCKRYARIRTFLTSGKAPLDFDGAWRAISRGSVGSTVYRVVADLRTGRLEVDRRLVPGGPFAPRVHVNVKKLIQGAHP